MNIILHSSGGWEVQIQCACRSGNWWRLSFQLADGGLPLGYSHGGEQKEKQVPPVSSHKDTPIMRVPPSWSHYFPKSPHPNATILGIRVSTCKFGQIKICRSLQIVFTVLVNFITIITQILAKLLYYYKKHYSIFFGRLEIQGKLIAS